MDYNEFDSTVAKSVDWPATNLIHPVSGDIPFAGPVSPGDSRVAVIKAGNIIPGRCDMFFDLFREYDPVVRHCMKQAGRPFDEKTVVSVFGR